MPPQLTGDGATVGHAYALLRQDVEHGTRVVPDVDHALAHHELLAAIERSAREGVRVTLVVHYNSDPRPQAAGHQGGARSCARSSPRAAAARFCSPCCSSVTLVVTVTLIARGGDAAPAAVNVVKGPHFIDVETPGVLTFENGDCFHDPAINEAMGEPRLNTVGCVGAENEVFTFVTLNDGPWDGARVTRESTAPSASRPSASCGADRGRAARGSTSTRCCRRSRRGTSSETATRCASSTPVSAASPSTRSPRERRSDIGRG